VQVDSISFWFKFLNIYNLGWGHVEHQQNWLGFHNINMNEKISWQNKKTTITILNHPWNNVKV